MMKFQTTAAYLSGAICGPIWGPIWLGAECGRLVNIDLRPEFNRLVGDLPHTFAEVLDLVLMEHGGDFQHARFTADTVIRIERRAMDGPGRYRVHTREIEVASLPECAALVDADAYVADFLHEA